MKRLQFFTFVKVLPLVMIVCAGCFSDSKSKSAPQNATQADLSAKEITSFSFLQATNSGLASNVSGVINGNTITLILPYKTNPDGLRASFTTTGTKVTVKDIDQESGVTINNFSSSVVYKVTAADSSTNDYTVNVTVAASYEKEITAFSIKGRNGSINGTNITVTVLGNATLNNLVATFATTGKTVTVNGKLQVSGETANDFRKPVIYTVTAADSSVEQYTVTVTKARFSKSRDVYYYNAGTDGIWFTADDLIGVYHSYTYDSNGNTIEDIPYNKSGTDSVWFTSDDAVDNYYKYICDSNGHYSRTIRYDGAGTDSSWFTPDDLVGWYGGNYMYDSDGNRTESVGYDKAGADGTWFTSDDAVYDYNRLTYDSNGNLIQWVYYSKPGPDAIWFTSDDIPNFIIKYSYNSNGNMTRYIHYYGAGADGVWFTADDAFNYYSYFYDSNGNKTRDISYNKAGTDNVWFTADDVIGSYTSYTYDSNGNKIRSISYDNAGTDNVWFTADDVITNYSSYTYDSNGNVSRFVYYLGGGNHGSGPDGIWLTSDDVPCCYTVYTYEYQ